MKELRQRIDTVVELIEMLDKVLVGGTRVDNAEIINVLSTNLLEVLPDIVDTYDRKELQPYREEVDYWVNQLDRLIQALQGEDKFFLYDVLVIETKESLIEYRERIQMIH